MKTEYWINIKVNGVAVKLLATIEHAPFCDWKIQKLTFRGMAPGVAVFYTPSLLAKDEMASANQQIEDQMLADELENELHQKSFNLLGSE